MAMSDRIMKADGQQLGSIVDGITRRHAVPQKLLKQILRHPDIVDVITDPRRSVVVNEYFRYVAEVVGPKSDLSSIIHNTVMEVHRAERTKQSERSTDQFPISVSKLQELRRTADMVSRDPSRKNTDQLLKAAYDILSE